MAAWTQNISPTEPLGLDALATGIDSLATAANATLDVAQAALDGTKVFLLGIFARWGRPTRRFSIGHQMVNTAFVGPGNAGFIETVGVAA